MHEAISEAATVWLRRHPAHERAAVIAVPPCIPSPKEEPMQLGLCLSRDEIEQLTRTPMRARQILFLQRNGIRHYIDNNGRPVVLRAAVSVEPAVVTAPIWRSNKALD